MTIPTNETALEARIQAALGPQGSILVLLRKAFPNALGVYVFGSRAQGGARADSDLDLAVLVDGYADPSRLWDLSSALAEVVGCEVDLLDLRAASTVMQYQILTQGRRLWAFEPDASLFESFVCSEMVGLNEARAGLLEDVAREGSVYGR